MDMHTYHIQSYCIIRERSIHMDGVTVLKTEALTTLNDFLKSAYRQLGIDYPKFYKMDALCKAVFIAVELMARKAGPIKPDTALIFSNYSSSHLSDEKHAMDLFSADNPMASPATFVYTLPNIAMGEISIRHKLHSENVFFIFDSYLPEFLVPYNDSVLDNQKTENIISGWAEVGEQGCDLFLYLIGKSGKTPHTVAYLKTLYHNEHE
ncbi:hypothetical protein [Parapedobacter tibetensis]|uniref:hypothetical protein n=1 Tax=Parapedobacter tibetensis TaxID=2972951 RepID=UPI00214D8724|nr:hypothetical protein [Parapedobacter tibetensis]